MGSTFCQRRFRDTEDCSLQEQRLSRTERLKAASELRYLQQAFSALIGDLCCIKLLSTRCNAFEVWSSYWKKLVGLAGRLTGPQLQQVDHGRRNACKGEECAVSKRSQKRQSLQQTTGFGWHQMEGPVQKSHNCSIARSSRPLLDNFLLVEAVERRCALTEVFQTSKFLQSFDLICLILSRAETDI